MAKAKKKTKKKAKAKSARRRPWVRLPAARFAVPAPKRRAPHTPPRLETFTSKDAAGPCPAVRKGCPVQLTFQKGRAYLRACVARKEPGFLVPVSDPADALAKARQICDCWSAAGKQFATCPGIEPGRKG